MRVVFFAKVPPPFGGGEIRARMVANYLENYDNFIVVKLTNRRFTKSNQGKLRFFKLWSTYRDLITMCYTLVKYRPNRFFFSLPKSRLAFLKFLPVFAISKILKISIYTELAGDRIFFTPNWFEKMMMRQIQSIRLLSYSISQKFLNFGINNIIVFPNSSDVQSFKEYRNNMVPGDYVIHVGTLSSEKGVDRLIEAFEIYRKNGGTLRLKLIGNWISFEFYKEIHDKYLDLFDNEIISVNNGDREIVAKNLSKSRGIFLLSLREGLPISLIEACYFNIPIVSSDVGFIKEWLGDYPNFTLTLNTEDVVKSLHSLENCAKINSEPFFEDVFDPKVFLYNFYKWLIL